jgi:hypothetical protein
MSKVEQDTAVETVTPYQEDQHQHAIYVAEGTGKTAHQEGAKERAVHNASPTMQPV